MRLFLVLGTLSVCAASMAGTWALSYTGGSATASPYDGQAAVDFVGPGQTPYWASCSASNFISGIGWTTRTATASGPFTIHGSWTPTYPGEKSPKFVIAQIYENAAGDGDQSTATTDFGTSWSGNGGGSSSGTGYRYISLSGTTFNTVIGPNASGHVDNQSTFFGAVRRSVTNPYGAKTATANVSATVTLYTPNITLGGAKFANNLYTIMIGQQLTAGVSLDGLPATSVSYAWQTPSDGSPFKNFIHTTSSGSKTPWVPGAETSSSTIMHFATDSGASTLKCTVTTVNPNFTFDVSSQPLKIEKPVVTPAEHLFGACINSGWVNSFTLWNAGPSRLRSRSKLSERGL